MNTKLSQIKELVSELNDSLCCILDTACALTRAIDKEGDERLAEILEELHCHLETSADVLDTALDDFANDIKKFQADL